MSFLNPDQRYTFLLDRVTHRPACVILQALYDCDKLPCYLFNEWETAPTPNFVRVTATGKQIEDLAAKIQNEEVPVNAH